MKKIILVFGLISGAISSILMAIVIPFGDRVGLDHSLVVGYATIVLSFLLVYFGIRSYRDNVGQGEITFTRGFTVGICITLISCLLYVVSWEILYYNFLPGFVDKWAAHDVAKLRAAGAGAAAIQAKIVEMKHYKELYDNPLLNGAMTFMEPFPVGLLITLLSAVVLRRKPRSLSAAPPLEQGQAM